MISEEKITAVLLSSNLSFNRSGDQCSALLVEMAKLMQLVKGRREDNPTLIIKLHEPVYILSNNKQPGPELLVRVILSLNSLNSIVYSKRILIEFTAFTDEYSHFQVVNTKVKKKKPISFFHLLNSCLLSVKGTKIIRSGLISNILPVLKYYGDPSYFKFYHVS